MAVAAVTPIRIVCANTLGTASLRHAEHGVGAQRAFRFRHTGNFEAKFAVALTVFGMTINYERRFKILADCLARDPFSSEPRLERAVLSHLRIVDEEMGSGAHAHRERAIEHLLAIFRGRGVAGDTPGNSPGSKWVAFNAIAEYLDYGRRYTSRTNQLQRSFEDASLKQRALELVTAAYSSGNAEADRAGHPGRRMPSARSGGGASQVADTQPPGIASYP